MLTFKKRVWIIKQKQKGILTDQQIADAQRTTRRHVQRLWVKYQSDGKEALRDKPCGRKVDAIPLALQDHILRLRKKQYGIHKICGLLQQEEILISKRKVINVLKKHGLHTPSPKKGRRYKYIRWQRNHSNSLWQTDFFWIEKLGCWLTGWLDDHSRLITSMEYVTEATTDTSLKVFEKGVKKYDLPRETLSDRGCQYYSNHPGNPSRFFDYMKQRGVRHIYANVKKPTTCGKLERWWRTHNDERWAFSSLQKFIRHYNYKRPHMSLGWKTPYEIWKKDLKSVK